MYTIFLSSTCYDLADLRSVLVHSLTTGGFATVASDTPSSEFAVFPSQNSVEICESNVARSDLLLLILDRRYGSPVPGFDGKSATHIEYETAVHRCIPVLTFVRKAFLSDHRLWQKMTAAGCSTAEIATALGHVRASPGGDKFAFVTLFEFFDSVRKANERGKSNWVEGFDTAHELSQLVLRRVKEVLQAEPIGIQLSLRSIAASPSPVSLSAAYLMKAMAVLGQLTLRDEELRLLADAAIHHSTDVCALVQRMSSGARTRFLVDRVTDLIRSDTRAVVLVRYKSAAVIKAVRACLDKEDEFSSRVTAFERLGCDHEFLTEKLRASLHEVLWQTYTVRHYVYRDLKRLHEKLSALRVIGRVGSAEDLSAVLRCLLERGVPNEDGDPEHVQIGDPTNISYADDEVMIEACKATLAELHKRGVCLLLHLLPKAWPEQLQCATLRINIARALVTVCDHMTAEQTQDMVTAILQKNGSDELCDELLEECAEQQIDLEERLLRSLHAEAELVSRSLVGLIWHATHGAVPELLGFVRECDQRHLPAAAYVLRFLVNHSTRQPVVDALAIRIGQLQALGANSAYMVRDIVSHLGARELLPFLDNRDSSRNDLERRKDVVEHVEKLELSRKSCLLRRVKSHFVVRSWDADVFVAKENACINEVRSLRAPQANRAEPM